MTDVQKPPTRRSAPQADTGSNATPPLMMVFSELQEKAATNLARAEGLTSTGPHGDLDTSQVLKSAFNNKRVRPKIGVGGAPRSRPDRSAPKMDVEQLLDEQPELHETMRRICSAAQALWPRMTTEMIVAFTDDLVDHLVDKFDNIDTNAFTTWLECVLLAGSATVPPQTSKDTPLRLNTREKFKAFSGLTDQNLAELERQLGAVGRPEAAMVTAVLVARHQNLIHEIRGIVAGTKHDYCSKEAQGLGRTAARAGVEDLANGPPGLQLDEAIYHTVCCVAFLAAETPDARQVLVRALTNPLVAPFDLRALKEDGASNDRMYVDKWLDDCGLRQLVESGDTSATAQVAHAARRLHDEYFKRTGQRLPVVIPAIRRERGRSHRVFDSPIGPYEREMPGNSLQQLRGLRRILGRKPQIWLAEVGIEDGDGPVQPDWKIRLPDRRFAPDRRFVAGGAPIAQPDLADWIDVFQHDGGLLISELELPVALSYERTEDLVLLRAIGESDVDAPPPTLWYVASRTLRSNPDLAARVGELLLRVHGSSSHSTALRSDRTESFAEPARVLGGRAKQPRQWMTRELERELAFLAAKLLRSAEDPVPPPPTCSSQRSPRETITS